MAEVACRIVRSDTGYRAEATQPGRVLHIAEGFVSESDAQRWTEECRRLVDIDEQRRS
jgi:hypothetical protein